MDDIDAMFSDLLGEMDLLTQVSLSSCQGIYMTKYDWSYNFIPALHSTLIRLLLLNV